MISICTHIRQFSEINLCGTYRVYFSWTSPMWRHRNHTSTITSLIAAKQTVATFHNKRRKKEDAIAIFYGEKINFIYLADKIFRIIRIIDFNRAEPTCYRTYFHCPISGEQNGAFWYIVLRIMLLTYNRAMIWFSNCGGLSRMMWYLINIIYSWGWPIYLFQWYILLNVVMFQNF